MRIQIQIRTNNYGSGGPKTVGSESGTLVLRVILLLMAGWAVDRAADGRCGRHRHGHAGQPRGTAQQVG
jgi:hypothetical protein